MTNDTAQILANCLDALERPGATVEQCVAPYPEQRGTLIELLIVAQMVRSAPAVTPSLDFRLDARQRLSVRLPPHRSRRARLVEKFSAWWQRWFHHKLMLFRTAFVLLVGLMLGTSVAVTAAESLPNDMLYPVKRTIEQARLILSPDVATSGHLHLTFAAERLAEVQHLIDRGRAAEAGIALDDFATQMQSVVAITQSMPDTVERTSLLARVAESKKTSDALLIKTRAQLPESAQAEANRARAVLVEQDRQPPVPPLFSTTSSPAGVATPSPTPMPVMTVPSVTHDVSRTSPAQIEPDAVHHSTDRPTTSPTRVPTEIPHSGFLPRR